MASSNQSHSERQVRSKASVRLVVERKHAAGTVGPQPVFGLQSLRYHQRNMQAHELKRRKGKRAEAHYVLTASHPQIERSLSQDFVESNAKRKTQTNYQNLYNSSQGTIKCCPNCGKPQSMKKGECTNSQLQAKRAPRLRQTTTK